MPDYQKHPMTVVLLIWYSNRYLEYQNFSQLFRSCPDYNLFRKKSTISNLIKVSQIYTSANWYPGLESTWGYCEEPLNPLRTSPVIRSPLLTWKRIKSSTIKKLYFLLQIFFISTCFRGASFALFLKVDLLVSIS